MSEALSAGFATEASARTAKQWFRDSERRIVPLVALLVFLGAWQLAASVRLINPLFFASPWAVIDAGYHDVRTALFWSDLRVSLTEFGIGYRISLSSGLMIGFAVVVVNMYTATTSVNPQYLRVARSFGCSQWRLLRTVTMSDEPSCLSART